MKKYSSQGVESDASTVEGALAQTQQSSIDRVVPKKMAQADPSSVKGYEVLGKVNIRRPKSTDNRGEGT